VPATSAGETTVVAAARCAARRGRPAAERASSVTPTTHRATDSAAGSTRGCIGPSRPLANGPRNIPPSTKTRNSAVRHATCDAGVAARSKPTGSIQPAMLMPKTTQPPMTIGSGPRPTIATAAAKLSSTTPSTRAVPTRSASAPTGSSAIVSESCASISRRAMPERSRPNSRLPRTGMTNCSSVA